MPHTREMQYKMGFMLKVTADRVAQASTVTPSPSAQPVARGFRAQYAEEADREEPHPTSWVAGLPGPCWNPDDTYPVFYPGYARVAGGRTVPGADGHRHSTIPAHRHSVPSGHSWRGFMLRVTASSISLDCSQVGNNKPSKLRQKKHPHLFFSINYLG